MNKRLITENWYKFLNETDYRDAPEEGLATQKALEAIEKLKLQKALIEKEIEELEKQISFGKQSVSQIKEDKDG